MMNNYVAAGVGVFVLLALFAIAGMVGATPLIGSEDNDAGVPYKTVECTARIDYALTAPGPENIRFEAENCFVKSDTCKRPAFTTNQACFAFCNTGTVTMSDSEGVIPGGDATQDVSFSNLGSGQVFTLEGCSADSQVTLHYADEDGFNVQESVEVTQ